MEQTISYNFLTSNVISSNERTQKYKFGDCNECKKGKIFDESHLIYPNCYIIKTVYRPKPSGNETIDEFIRYTQINCVKEDEKMEFVPYDQFKNVEFIAEGGFSKIYKAIWIDGPVSYHYDKLGRHQPNYTAVLKKLNDSKNVTTKELNELKVFYGLSLKDYSYGNISKYYGITQNPNTKDIMIIMPYYESGDLIHYLSNNFYNITWHTKLDKLRNTIDGLRNIHKANFIHRDLHSGNILLDNKRAFVSDFGISQSATESTNDSENYGIIPYMAPEIFQGEKYTKASDIYSFGMIMWELMTGRRPFWDRNHDAELIVDICNGLRPPIVTNAPDGYIELMKDCWNSDPEKRPSVNYIDSEIYKMYNNKYNNNPTEIIESLDIGPVTTNNPGAIYRSRPLSGMIHSAMSLRNQSINHPLYTKNTKASIDNKRRFEDNDLIEENNYLDRVKRTKLSENENYQYITREQDFDI